MRSLVLIIICCCICCCAACGGAPARPEPGPTAAPVADADWDRVHALIDGYDAALWARDAEARKQLPHVEQGTTAVVDAIRVDVDRILQRDRLHPGALAAATLLDYDRRPARGRRDLLPRMAALKAIARGAGPLAANATFRLWGFCAQAFRDAVRAPARDRALMLSNCLYPLYDADPAPYFAAEPARRPPPPRWKDLRADLDALAGQTRFADALRAELARLVEDADGKGLLPRDLDPQRLRLPLVTATGAAEPFDGEPVALVNGKPVPGLEFQIRPLLEEDGRGRVVLSLTADQPAQNFLDAAAMARTAGAGQVGLAVGVEQTLRAPPGDYWHTRAVNGKILRFSYLPMTTGQPAKAALGLRLFVGARRWQLAAPSGAFAPLPPGGVKQLREQLSLVRSAFADEDGLSITPEEDATIADLAAAAQGALRAADGSRLFGQLALDTSPPPAVKGDLAERARRRAAAQVTVTPDGLAARIPSLRRCYQEALDRAPQLAGTLVVENARATGLADEALRRCVADRLASTMAEARIQRVQIDLRLDAKLPQ